MWRKCLSSEVSLSWLFERFLGVMLWIDEKRGLDRHKVPRCSKLWLGPPRKVICPVISMPDFVVSMVSGMKPSPEHPDGRLEISANRKKASIAIQISGDSELMG